MKRVCKNCKYEWQSRASSPKMCPACKSRHWRKGKTPKDKEEAAA